MSAILPAEACAIQEFTHRFETDLADPFSQSPVTDAATSAYDAAAYYEQLALMLEAENMAFQMAKVPQAPPGLDYIMPPPGLEPDCGGSSRQQLVKKGTYSMTRQICWFQNRYHHAKPDDNMSHCSRGDDCQFCHAYHPKLSRRDGPKSLCSCAAHCMKQQPPASDSASTRDDDCSLETSSSDESSNVSSSKALQVIHPVPTPEVVPLPRSSRMNKKHTILDLKADDAQTDSTESPPMLRQICYFQNRWHNRQEADEAFDSCSKGDDCLHCHETHPRIKRRNDKSSRCSCPIKHH